MANYGIALGSNLGDRLKNIAEATGQLAEHGRIVASAPIYKSTPVDCSPDDPFFYNTALELEIDLEPEDLLTLTQSIEKKLGRREKTHPNAPREIDLDLLYQTTTPPGSSTGQFRSATLHLPHPRQGGCVPRGLWPLAFGHDRRDPQQAKEP